VNVSTGTRPPEVSVVVPVYQVEDYVVAALESLRAQTYSAWECIVVDDGSRDASADRARTVVDSDPRFRLVHQENRGLAAARNTGLSQSSPSASYVAFLDSDDVWEPTALADLVAVLGSDASAVGAYGLAELLDAEGRPLQPGLHPSRQRDRRRISGRRLRSVPSDQRLTFDELVVVGPIWPPAVALHRKSVVDVVGPFDTSLRQLEDWDFYLRMSRHGDYLPVPQHLAWYRQHGGQMTRRTIEHVVALDAVRRKTWSSPENTPAQRRAATRAWRQLQVRRTGRCGQRAVRALAQRKWLEAGQLTVATVVLLAQNFAAGPPHTTAWLARWSRRTL
jgi:glycosyltransferase involved in cell wall biosynthesis